MQKKNHKKPAVYGLYSGNFRCAIYDGSSLSDQIIFLNVLWGTSGSNSTTSKGRSRAHRSRGVCATSVSCRFHASSHIFLVFRVQSDFVVGIVPVVLGGGEGPELEEQGGGSGGVVSWWYHGGFTVVFC